MTEFIRPGGRFLSRFALPLVVLFIIGLVLVACGDASPTTAPNTTASATTAAASTTQATSAAATTATPVALGSAAPSQTTAAAAPTNTAAATTAAAGTTAAGNAKPTATIPVPTIASPAEAKQTLETVAQQAAKTRKLDFKTPVEKFFMTRDAMGKYFLETFNRDNPPEEIAKYQKINELFGFIPKSFDLAKAYNELQAEQVLGFYDPQTKKFYVVVDQEPNKVSPLAKFTAEHELTHALQDQYYDIQKLRPQRTPGQTEGDDDRDLGVLSLIEGDASLSQTLWVQNGNLSRDDLNALLKEIQGFSSSKLDQAPLILKDTLQFPYDQGLKFVQTVYNKGGWDAVNKIFSEYPPRSTAQILHPEKYEKRVDPVKVELPSMLDTLGQGWKSIETNTMGELQARIWLNNVLSTDEATRSVNGWAGDRYQVVADGQGRYGYVWRTQWDSETVAASFFKGSTANLSKIYNLSGEGGSAQKRTWSGAEFDVSLVQKGNQVLIVTLPKGTGTDKVLAKYGF